MGCSPNNGLGVSLCSVAQSVADGKWVDKTDFSVLDFLFSPFLPLTDLPLNIDESGIAPTAEEVTIDRKENNHTIILATVKAGAWKRAWACSLLGLIIDGYTHCSRMDLLAIKGGWACDCEIEFIQKVMLALGFDVVTDGCHVAVPAYTAWQWEIMRPGAEPYMVLLSLYDNVEELDPQNLATLCAPDLDDSNCRPNLYRIAAVSAPVVDMDGVPIAERLNNNMAEALRLAREGTKQIGFHSDETDQQWCKFLGIPSFIQELPCEEEDEDDEDFGTTNIHSCL